MLGPEGRNVIPGTSFGAPTITRDGVSDARVIDLEVVEGLQVGRGYLSPYFVTDPDRMEIALERPATLIHEKKLSSMKDLLPLLERRAAASEGSDVIPARTLLSGRSKASPFRGLCEYLEKRFADTTVLTLQQVQDLLGVPLPDPAFTDPAWWSNIGMGASDTLWSDAWTLANRTARPNLRASTVIVQRHVPQ
jgi:hypothetical protein